MRFGVVSHTVREIGFLRVPLPHGIADFVGKNVPRRRPHVLLRAEIPQGKDCPRWACVSHSDRTNLLRNDLARPCSANHVKTMELSRLINKKRLPENELTGGPLVCTRQCPESSAWPPWHSRRISTGPPAAGPDRHTQRERKTDKCHRAKAFLLQKTTKNNPSKSINQ